MACIAGTSAVVHRGARALDVKQPEAAAASLPRSSAPISSSVRLPARSARALGLGQREVER